MKFGIELEMTAAVTHGSHGTYGTFYQYVLLLLRESGITTWRMDEDASCGNEFVSPPLEGENGWAQVEQVIHCVNTAKDVFGFKRIIGNDSGVHFHYDANDLVKLSNRNVSGLRNILILGAILEPLWFSMNPSARFETNFAAPLNFNMFQMMRARDMTDMRDIWFRPYQGVSGHQDSFRVKNSLYMPHFINNTEMKPDKYDWTRYHGLNFVSVFKHGTIEFRYTHGSFDINNITMWYQLYKKVVEAGKIMRTKNIVASSPVNLETIKMNSIPDLQANLYANLKLCIDFLFKIVEPDVKLLRFILGKIIKYNPDALPKQTILKILDFHGDFKDLMALIQPLVIQSIHYKKGRYKYRPPEHLQAQVGENQHPTEFPPELGVFDDDVEPEDGEDQ